MIDLDLITRKITLISRDLAALGPLAAKDEESYLASPTDEPLAERYLERMIGRMIDINYHLLTEQGHPPPADDHQSFLELSHLGVLEPDFARRIAAAAGLRNRLVHEYNDIEPRKVHQALQEALRDIPMYLRHVRDYATAHAAGA